MTQSIAQRILDRLSRPDPQEQLNNNVVTFTDVYGIFTGERNGWEVYHALHSLKASGKIEFVVPPVGWGRPGYRVCSGQ